MAIIWPPEDPFDRSGPQGQQVVADEVVRGLLLAHRDGAAGLGEPDSSGLLVGGARLGSTSDTPQQGRVLRKVWHCLRRVSHLYTSVAHIGYSLYT